MEQPASTNTSSSDLLSPKPAVISTSPLIKPTQPTTPIPLTRTVLYLDPNEVIIEPTPNRLEISYNTARFHGLLSNIRASRRNIVPIDVRFIPGTPGRYVLISGERRLRACRLAQVPVLVLIAASGTDANDSLNRLRENIGRQDLSPWETAQQVKAVQSQLQPIKNYELAALLGVSASMISRALDLCSLPGDIYRPSLPVADRHPIRICLQTQVCTGRGSGCGTDRSRCDPRGDPTAFSPARRRTN